MSSISRREGGGSGCPVDIRRRRRHRGDAGEGKEGDATPDLLLKYSYATLATYV
jgi:hypothetical protein